MAAPYMASGISLPESNAPYAIYYVPIAQDDKTGAKAVADNLSREAGFSTDFSKPAKESESLDPRREYLLGLNQSPGASAGLDHNPLEEIQMTPRLYAANQLTYGSGRSKPAFARSHHQGNAMYMRYTAKEPITSQLSTGKSARGQIKATVTIDSGTETTVYAEPETVVAEIIRMVTDQLGSLNEDQKNRYLNDYGLFYGDMKLEMLKKLKEYGITAREVQLTFKPTRGGQYRRPDQAGAAMAGDSVVPILSKAGYFTQPPYSDICRMTEEELSQVESFTIWNDWGKVQFLGKTDLRGLNLDQLISIEKSKVEIYPEDTEKPAVGQGLNKSATITFYRYGLKNKANLAQWLEKFKQSAAKIGAEYIGHDLQEDSVTLQVEGNNN